MDLKKKTAGRVFSIFNVVISIGGEMFQYAQYSLISLAVLYVSVRPSSDYRGWKNYPHGAARTDNATQIKSALSPMS